MIPTPSPKTTLAPMALLAAGLWAGAATAQEERTGWSIGVGAAFGATAYVGDNDDVLPLPILRYQGESFSVGTDGARFDLTRNDAVRIEGLVQPRFTALDDPGAIELSGLDREITLDAGFKLTYALTERVDLNATLLQEVTGEHDGQEISAGAAYGLRLGPVPVTLGGGVAWRSDDLTNYIYGVRANEARADRPAYDTGSSWTPYLNVRAALPLSERITAIGAVRAEFHGNDVTDSPIVDDELGVAVFLGITYGF